MPVAPIASTRVDHGISAHADDILGTEEPLEIRLGHWKMEGDAPEHHHTYAGS
jgi:hypothetical protein